MRWLKDNGYERQFVMDAYFNMKEEAQNYADKQRKRGINARVLRGQEGWEVFVEKQTTEVSQ